MSFCFVFSVMKRPPRKTFRILVKLRLNHPRTQSKSLTLRCIAMSATPHSTTPYRENIMAKKTITKTQAPANAAKKAPKAKPATDAKVKRMSAIDAAAKVLGETNQPMTTKEMIEAMAARKYWTSPGGKTPASTLYSAILREIATKGKEARFTKTERGKFAAKA